MMLRINIPVWGTYIDTMMDVLLPSLLAPGNITALHKRHPIAAIDVCTLPGDVERMQEHPLMRRIAAIAPVLFHPLDAQRASGLHHLLSLGHAVTLDAARAQNQGCVMLAPDVVLADGALGALGERITDATRAVLIASVRAECCGALEDLAAFYDDDGVLKVSARDLIRALLFHPHPVTASLVVSGALSSTWPSHLYWPVGDEGLIAHCFHMHPLYVRPSSAAIQDTLDGTYVEQLAPDGAGVVYVETSDEIALIELSRLGHMANTIRHYVVEPAQVAHWARYTATPMQRGHAAHRIRLYAGKPTRGRWKRAEEEADQFLKQIGL